MWATLVFFYWRVWRSLPFNWLLLAFGAFIVTCGGTHVVHILIDDNPGALANPVLLWSSIAIHTACVLSSGATAMALPFVVPKARGTLAEASVSDERKRQLETAYWELEGPEGDLLALTEELTQCNHELRQGLAARDDFLASVAYELKTPIATLIRQVE
jgi:signal transduction histidine kinase